MGASRRPRKQGAALGKFSLRVLEMRLTIAEQRIRALEARTAVVPTTFTLSGPSSPDPRKANINIWGRDTAPMDGGVG